MLRSAAPGTSPGPRQLTPGRRASPSASASSADSSPASTLSTKEQRQQQLQVLQRQQQQHFRMQRQQQHVDEQFLGTDRSGQGERAAALMSQQKHERSSPWASQELKDAWISVGQEAAEKEHSLRWERRNSHLSDKHMNIGAMKLLSDETPPDDMDGSWGLDNLDDLEDDRKHQHTHESHKPTTTSTLRFNEKNDSNIAKNNDTTITTTTTTQGGTASNENYRNNKSPHGYVNMGKEGRAAGAEKTSRSQSRQLQTHADCANGNGDVQGDSDHYNSSSFLSTHVRTSSPASRKNSSSSKYPWRDSKHDTIFTDLMDDRALMEQLRDQDASTVTPQPQSISRNTVRRDSHTSGAETSLSLSLGDIIDAVNNGDESLDPARSAKLRQAKLRLAELSTAGNAQDSSEDCPGPTSNSPAGRTFQDNQEAFRQQRLRVIKAAMKIDPNDDRSLAPLADNNDFNILAKAHGHLQIRTAAIPSKLPSNMPSSSRSSRVSYGTRHRSQGSRDTEIGDRGSTTSRDSVYRDSLSGSTLGSAGFQAQLDGINKHEMANVFTALKSAVIAQLSSEPVTKQDSIRILPHDVNVSSKSQSPVGQPQDVLPPRQPSAVDAALSEDTDATPKPKDRTSSSSTHYKRIYAENNPARAKQYAILASRALSKQTSSFVEELANATALKSATDSSFKNAPSQESQNLDQPSLNSGPSGSKTHEQHEGAGINSDLNERQKREVTFKSASFTEQEEDEESPDAEMEDLGSLAGSRAMENAFKSLEDLDMSFDMAGGAKNNGMASAGATESNRRPQTEDESAGDFLSAVLLSSKPKRKGEYSLKWEHQLETVSNADTSRVGIDTSISRSSSNAALSSASNMMPEQSSFSHAESHLVHFITGVHPWDEWEDIKTLDLSKKEIESTITLNHLVRNLEVLILNENKVDYLTGVPKSVKTLQVRSNLLSDLTNFSHMANLQYLDISHNAIEDLTGLSCLVHLRELIAEGNSIRSVSALQQMDGLIRLDVSHNCLTSLDFQYSKLQRLEFLNASHNKIEQLENLESLVGLIHANLAHNCIEDVSLVQPLRRLRILRLSENKLATFDATPFPGLRTLYLDDNRLHSLENCQKLTRIENFSARDQEGEGIAIDMTEFINSRKLYLSGNPIHALDFGMGFYRLEYLEICAGCLSVLPFDFAALFPNLRGLNLSYNGLDSISALEGLHRLRRLIFVGNSLKSFDDVRLLVKRMRSLVTLDLRHNPLTSNMYPTMSIRQGSTYQDTYRTNQSSETGLDWRRRDAGFRRALPDKMYVKRCVYRSAIIKSCKRLEWFDGGAIQLKERERAPVVLGDMMENYGWSHLTSNRREDEEEDFELEGEYEEYNAPEGIVDEQQEADWLYDRAQLEQLNQNGEVGEDEYFDPNERDPEDISDHSKRQGSSVDSGSLNGRFLRDQQRQQHGYAPKSPLSSRSGAAQQQPRQLRSTSGYHIASPSPKGTILSSKMTRMGASRMNSSSTISQQQQQQQQQSAGSIYAATAAEPTRRRLGERLTSAEHGPDVEEEHYEESSDKRSAVRTWRDEVNEVSHRKLHSPRVFAATAGSSSAQGVRSMSQQLRHAEKASVSGSGSGSCRGSQKGSAGATLEGHEISTTAVANNSDETRGPLERRRSSSRKLNIPTPSPAQQRQQPLVFQQRHSMHSRRRSDGMAMTGSIVRPPSSTQQVSRPYSQHGMLGFENGEAGASPLHHSQQLPLSQHHQLSMSPMGGPSGMTSSGTILRPAHQRRRSFAAFPHGSAISRKKELLGLDTHYNNNAQITSPGHPGAPMSMSMQVVSQSPMASPGYFGMNHHHSMQSPFGFAKNAVAAAGTPAAAGGASSGRSLPNTPSRGGRASRVSLGPGPQPYPQTLARDMERSGMAD